MMRHGRISVIGRGISPPDSTLFIIFFQAGIACYNRRVNILRNIYLVGLMGAGKTTIGRQLAKRLDMRFADSDHEIEARTGVRIPLIFEIEGEAGFRKRESQVLLELTQQKDRAAVRYSTQIIVRSWQIAGWSSICVCSRDSFGSARAMTRTVRCCKLMIRCFACRSCMRSVIRYTAR